MLGFELTIPAGFSEPPRFQVFAQANCGLCIGEYRKGAVCRVRHRRLRSWPEVYGTGGDSLYIFLKIFSG